MDLSIVLSWGTGVGHRDVLLKSGFYACRLVL